MTNVEYILKNIDFQAPHWLWKLSKDPSGYGVAYDKIDRKRIYAHRLSYRTFIGDIPENLEVGHLCNFRHCISPICLKAMTHEENCSTRRRRNIYSGRTHCKRGHKYVPGCYYCKICKVAGTKKWRERSKQCHG